jgi:hypothetical protein
LKSSETLEGGKEVEKELPGTEYVVAVLQSVRVEVKKRGWNSENTISTTGLI